MSPRKPTRRAVRDPVQVYLAPDDRKLLDSLARATGLSRAEVDPRSPGVFSWEEVFVP